MWEHHKLTCKERFETFDNKEFELIRHPSQDDPLNFEDKKKYTDRLKQLGNSQVKMMLFLLLLEKLKILKWL